jgi:hypothetical protein
MPGTLNDFIVTSTGGPTVNDGLLSYFKAGGATATNLADAERQWLKIQSPVAEGSNQDLWVQYLSQNLGFEGTLNDMLLQFWRGDASVGVKYLGTITPGTSGGSERGFLTAAWGSLNPTLVESKLVYKFSADQNGSLVQLRVGAAGNEQVTGGATIVYCGLPGNISSALVWNAGSLRYETQNVNWYFILQSLLGTPSVFFIDY